MSNWAKPSPMKFNNDDTIVTANANEIPTISSTNAVTAVGSITKLMIILVIALVVITAVILIAVLLTRKTTTTAVVGCHLCPGSSYTGSCSSCSTSTDGCSIACTCNDGSGTPQSTSLTISPGTDNGCALGNNNGQLNCDVYCA